MQSVFMPVAFKSLTSHYSPQPQIEFQKNRRLWTHSVPLQRTEIQANEGEEWTLRT